MIKPKTLAYNYSMQTQTAASKKEFDHLDDTLPIRNVSKQDQGPLIPASNIKLKPRVQSKEKVENKDIPQEYYNTRSSNVRIEQSNEYQTSSTIKWEQAPRC